MEWFVCPAMKGKAVPPTTFPPWAAYSLIVAAVAATYAVGALSATSAPNDYANWQLPSWAPPAWLFGPVWTVLYVLIAAAGVLVYRHVRTLRRPEWALFGGQLLFNALWTPLFFAWGLRGFAFAWILVLDVLVALTIWTFWRQRPLYGALLVPYQLWILFASALNLSVWLLNR